MANKIDYKKELKEFYKPPKNRVVFVDVPLMNYIMVDGKGNPNNSKEFQEAMETLFPVAYGIKFRIKKEQGVDFGVMPPEGLWWSDNMDDLLNGNKDNWQWTVMIMQPDVVSEEIYHEVVKEVTEKKSLAMIDKIRFEAYDEGLSAQIMHVGSYDSEHENIMKIHNAIKEGGYELRGKHHEIYLKDFRRTKPENLLTVVRQPMGVKN